MNETNILYNLFEAISDMPYYENQPAASGAVHNISKHEDAVEDLLNQFGFKKITEEIPNILTFNKKKNLTITKKQRDEWENGGDSSMIPNMTYISQPCSTHETPDFLVKYNGKLYFIECKSSKSNACQPVWNDHYPRKNYIYIYSSGKKNKTTFFLGLDVLSDEERKIIDHACNRIKKIAEKTTEKLQKKDEHGRGWKFSFRPKIQQEGGKLKTNYFEHINKEKCKRNVLEKINNYTLKINNDSDNKIKEKTLEFSMDEKEYKLITGDSSDILEIIDENYFDACITDPPYGMNMDIWDTNVPPVELWGQVLRTLKPGAFCLSFCSPQLYHRLATNIEEAGFQIVDQIMWMTTTKMASGNKLKPAHEPIVVALKPFKGTIDKNIEKWGVGRVDTDGTRIPWDKEPPTGWVADGHSRRTFGRDGKTTGSGKEHGTVDANPKGRYPMNIIGEVENTEQKYFYAPRVARKERGEYNDHPTPKPINLMRYLIRGFTPKNGLVLDPFMGSGSTGIGALYENKRFYGIDLNKHYVEISEKRIEDYLKEQPEKLFPYDD